MNKDDIKFTLDQLRQDKIIYAVEACATNLACLLLILFASVFFSEPLQGLTIAALPLIGVGYTVYMGVTNFQRLKKIKKLEQLLSSQ